ncbi:hypothetical protein SAMN05660657_03745 [Geodermatophilus amargosae]|uniref:Uncharacterized protein n=1 Tax=Geodermatophilus amargosae TaxID=1296565 RepID=A0A1I7BPU6_9ACTN|nr:hypothetical protein [Geodermatophilus amargosae]SFT89179.1 hypothetical protein SAMN05660657_03745 [Geodermatophilus amargosae]
MATNSSRRHDTRRGGPSNTATRRAVRAALLLVYGPLVALGGLLHPWTSLTLGALGAATSALGCTALHRRCSAELPGLPHPALAAAAGGTLPAALAGTTSLNTSGSVIVTATLLLATAGFGRWLAAEAGRPTGAPSTRTGAAGDPDLLRQVLESVPLDVLFDEWHGIRVRSGSRASDTALAEVQLRALVVDEFARRDPVGTARWLTEGPDEPPENHVRRPEDVPG